MPLCTLWSQQAFACTLVGMSDMPLCTAVVTLSTSHTQHGYHIRYIYDTHRSLYHPHAQPGVSQDDWEWCAVWPNCYNKSALSRRQSVYLNFVGNHGHYVYQWSNDRETENRRDHRFMCGIKLCYLSVPSQICSCVHWVLHEPFFAVSKCKVLWLAS
jgi:hypothetical protein